VVGDTNIDTRKMIYLREDVKAIRRRKKKKDRGAILH